MSFRRAIEGILAVSTSGAANSPLPSIWATVYTVAIWLCVSAGTLVSGTVTKAPLSQDDDVTYGYHGAIPAEAAVIS